MGTGATVVARKPPSSRVPPPLRSCAMYSADGHAQSAAQIVSMEGSLACGRKMRLLPASSLRPKAAYAASS